MDRLVLKTMQISSYENTLKFLLTNSEHSRYIMQKGSYKLNGTFKDHCFTLWRTAVITWDNKMMPYCFDKDANYLLGNLNELSVREIWKSALYQNFRQGVLLNLKGNSMCNNCTEGLKRNIFQMEN